MIGTELLKGQGLGNALFCYITTRCIAKSRGVDFTVIGKEILEGISGEKNGLYFMDLDFGIPAVKEDFCEKYYEEDERIFLGNSIHDCKHGCYISSYDSKMLNCKDNSLLYGNMQAEEYFLPYKDQIKEWLKIKPEYDSYEYTQDNLCIINIRGGEYTGSPELFVRRKYWLDSIAYMKTIRSDMKFITITDDVEAAKRILPEVEAYHFSLDKDYVTIKNAKYLIASNSSFAFFPVFTSDTLKMIIAPKYWARHNVSDGYWASEQNIYTGWNYMDRKGKLFSAEECRKELQDYKRKSRRYKKINKHPNSLVKKTMMIQSKSLYYLSFVERIVRSLKRRLSQK